MPKSSEKSSSTRREEIMDACASLYETMSFKDITVKEISKFISTTRTSIYNYFRTKEEIFLAVFKREYEYWIENLKKLTDENDKMSSDEFASALASSLDKRPLLLKLLSMNMYDMEENSGMPRLVEFKRAYGNSVQAVRDCLNKFFPDMTESEKQEFMLMFFPFIYGIYPYTFTTEKQRTAIERAGIEYTPMSVYEISYIEIKKLLGSR